MTFLADRVTNVPVSFRQLRMKDAEGALQEGVVGATDLKMVQRAAGANQSVDFSVGAGYINIDSGTRSGLAHFYNDAVANVAVPASNATNPRIDQAIVRYNDSSIPAGTGGNTPTPEILPGTATAGATLDNRTGAAALPNDCLRLADILVPATSTSVTTANIRDRRPWARGALADIVYTAGTSQNLPTTFAAIPTISAGLQQRVECSGAPIIIEATVTRIQTGPSSGATGGVLPAVDGALAAAVGTADFSASTVAAVVFIASPTKRWRYTPAAGSHLFTLWGQGTATGVIWADATDPVRFTVWEDMRSVANNGTT